MLNIDHRLALTGCCTLVGLWVKCASTQDVHSRLVRFFSRSTALSGSTKGVDMQQHSQWNQAPIWTTSLLRSSQWLWNAKPGHCVVEAELTLATLANLHGVSRLDWWWHLSTKHFHWFVGMGKPCMEIKQIQKSQLIAVYVPTHEILSDLVFMFRLFSPKKCSSDSSGDFLQFSAPISTAGTRYTCLLWRPSGWISTMLCGHWPEPKPLGSVAYSLCCICKLTCALVIDAV